MERCKVNQTRTLFWRRAPEFDIIFMTDIAMTGLSVSKISWVHSLVAGSPVSDSESAGFDDDAGQDDLGDGDLVILMLGPFL